MKPNYAINRIRIALSYLALALAIILLSVPLLAKGIAEISGNPIQPEKLDVRPIPVPTPPVSTNQPSVSKTLSSSLVSGLAPQPVPAPTPSVSVAQTALAESQMPEASASFTVHITNRQEFLAMALVFVVLLTWMWLHRAPSFQSLTKKSA